MKGTNLRERQLVDQSFSSNSKQKEKFLSNFGNIPRLSEQGSEKKINNQFSFTFSLDHSTYLP
jgi:hypothetical protein